MFDQLGQLARARRQPHRAAAHVRCIMDNVGDRLVDEAIRAMLADLTLVDYTPSRKVALVERLTPGGRLFRYTCLGGGTLIFGDIERGWGLALETILPRTETAFAFGTGVVDLDFRRDLATRFGKRPITEASNARWIDCLDRFRWIGVRGNASRARLEQAGLHGVEVTGDPVLHFARQQVVAKAGRRRIGLNVADRSYFFGDANARVAPLMSTVLRALIDRGFEVTLFPMTSEDDAITDAVIAAAGRPPVSIFDGYRSTRSLLDALASMDVFCGMRLHATAAAVCVYTPALMVGYQPKNHEFMETLGLDAQHVRIDEAEADDLIERLGAMHDAADEIQQRQFAACQPFRSRLLDLRDRIVATL